jgi:adenine-specific DNA-methyltransferase
MQGSSQRCGCKEECGVSKYDHLGKDELVRLLTRRDTERQLGLVWERDDIDPDTAINDDYVALDLDPALSHDQAPWRNLIIEGDNYDALRALRMSHAGRIRCIYIDPPYNTGNRDFVYNDRFIDKSHRFRHSLWLEFMYKRLRLAKDLLADDGVIFVSIDDNELFRLGMLMDEVFGAERKLACFAWQTDGNFDNQAKIKICHEYILAYSPNPEAFPMPPVVDPNTPEGSKLFRPEIRNTIVKNGPKNPVAEITLPIGFPASFDAGMVPARTNKWPRILSDIHVVDGRVQAESVLSSGWANRELCQEFIDGGFEPIRDSKGQSTTFVLTANGAIENVKLRESPSHVMSVLRNLGNTQSDSAMLTEMGISFTYPKPVSMLNYLLSILDDKQATFLDFFAGSGTTAHAITKLNAEDGGDRRFILVSSTEATDEQPDKNLCRDVCAERVRRVMGGYTNAKGEAVAGLGGSFAYLRARRIPPHRLSLKLEHAEVWHALQLLHDRPLSPWPNTGFAADGTLAYLADFREAHVACLRDWLAGIGDGATIYCWAPERVRKLAPDADWQPIPQSLRARFGR